MYDLVHGGSTNGSGVYYEVTNPCSKDAGGIPAIPDTDTPHGFNEWNDYDHDDPEGTAIGVSVRSPHNKFGTVCTLADDADWYHDGASSHAGIGDKIFTNACISIPYSGASGWFKHTDPVGGGIYVTVIGATSATVTSAYPC